MVVLLSVLLPAAFCLLAGAGVYLYMSKNRLDSLWQLHESELVYANPPVIIGKGSFGLVLQADCRGTTVAVKRVLPPKGGAVQDDQDMFELDRWVERTAQSSIVNKEIQAAIIDADSLVCEDLRGRNWGPEPHSPSLSSVNSDHTARPHTDGNQSGGASVGAMYTRKGSRASSRWQGGVHLADGNESKNGLQLEKLKMLAAIQSGSTTELFQQLQAKVDVVEAGAGAEAGARGHASHHANRKALYAQSPSFRHRFPTAKREVLAENDHGSISQGGRAPLSEATSEPDCSCLPWDYYSQSRQLKSLRSDFVEEMRIISNLRHPSITTVMGAVLGKEPMLVMEYMTLGSLSDLLLNESYLLEPDVLLVMIKDIVQGMRFLHTAEVPIVHGDLKAANVLITENFKAKVADFGLSQKKRLGNFGTPYWMAPELLQGNVSTTESDVYAFGIMLYEIFSRKDPYAGEIPSEVLLAIADLARVPEKRPGIPAGCRPEIEVMMKDCWNNDPAKRPPFMELDRRIKAMDVAGMQSLAVRGSTQEELKRQATTQRVLFDIFPKHIAEALVAGRKVEPEKKDCVTIFFSDIVGFTDLSAMLDPSQVSDMLDRLYTAFDLLSQKHQVYKVETIGDAYMAVTNLVSDQSEDHAARIARFALDALKMARTVQVDLSDPSKGFLNIRVGFHSGPVVANVVGTRCPRYCLFGDTVNTASRMESNSKPNMINCSLAAAKLVHRQAGGILLQKRGLIPIKGKGHIACYWVKGEVDPARFRDGSGGQPQGDSSVRTRNSQCEHGEGEGEGLNVGAYSRTFDFDQQAFGHSFTKGDGEPSDIHLTTEGARAVLPVGPLKLGGGRSLDSEPDSQPPKSGFLASIDSGPMSLEAFEKPKVKKILLEPTHSFESGSGVAALASRVESSRQWEENDAVGLEKC